MMRMTKRTTASRLLDNIKRGLALGSFIAWGAMLWLNAVYQIMTRVS